MNSHDRQMEHLIDDAPEDCCYICRDGGSPLQFHHTSYFPERTVRVCSTCHAEIHADNGRWEHLEPDDNRPPAYNSNRNRQMKWGEKRTQFECVDCASKFLKAEIYPLDGLKYGGSPSRRIDKMAGDDLNHDWICYRCLGLR